MRMIDCLHATPEIEERANNIAIVCATVPDPTTILLSLNGAEELVARIGRVRETMQPAVPDQLPLGGVIELVHTHDMGAWPDQLSGKLVLRIVSHSAGGRSWSKVVNPPMPALFTSMSTRPKVLSTRAAVYSSWCSTVTSQGMTSVLPPESAMARAVPSKEDCVRPRSTAVAPSAARLRAMAAPMPRPAPVMTATFPAIGCLVSIPLSFSWHDRGRPCVTEGTSSFSAIRILAIKRWANGNALAFGKRGTYNPASREKGSAATTLQPGQPFLSRGHLPGSPGVPKQDPNAKRSSRNAVLEVKQTIPV